MSTSHSLHYDETSNSTQFAWTLCRMYTTVYQDDQIGPKLGHWVRLAPNGTNPGLFQSIFNEFWSGKVPDLFHFGPIWSTLRIIWHRVCKSTVTGKFEQLVSNYTIIFTCFLFFRMTRLFLRHSSRLKEKTTHIR